VPDLPVQFGKYLLENQRQEWAAQYVDYKGLKDLIKDAAEQARRVSRPLPRLVLRQSNSCWSLCTAAGLQRLCLHAQGSLQAGKIAGLCSDQGTRWRHLGPLHTLSLSARPPRTTRRFPPSASAAG
jgi:hypothetical protein